MRILYYSTAFHASHGGSSQSILFYKELQKNQDVDHVSVFPKKKPTTALIGEASNKPLRKFLRSIPLLQIFFFYRRNQFYLEQLEKEIEKDKPDVLIIQLDSTFLQVRYLKKKFPSLLITTQVNSSP